MVSLFNKTVAEREGRFRTQLSAKRVFIQPDQKLNRLAACVLKAIVNIVIKNGGPCAEGNAPALIGKQRIGVVMQLGHRQRAVEDQQMDHVAQLAKSAADSGAQSVLADHQPIFIAFFCGRPSDGVPKGEHLARPDQQSVYLRAGKTQVFNFILLKLQINGVQFADQNGAVPFDDIGQRRQIMGFCERRFAMQI